MNKCITQFLPLIAESARFELDLKHPKIMLFTSSTSSTYYRGPKKLFGLLSFIDEENDGGALQTKV